MHDLLRYVFKVYVEQCTKKNSCKVYYSHVFSSFVEIKWQTQISYVNKCQKVDTERMRIVTFIS